MPTTGYDRDVEQIGMGSRRPLWFRLTLWGHLRVLAGCRDVAGRDRQGGEGNLTC
jgi:hypothetical protein